MEFISYIQTPQEKHLGIVTVKLYGKIIARYKIVPSKSGDSFFAASPSLKMPEDYGQDCYVSSFMLDSNSENEILMNMIRAKVKEHMKAEAPPVQQSYQSSASIHNSYQHPDTPEVPF